ncbi:hypothetical protein ACH5RR_005101 [Cinchona calisaya]|uniref:Bromo domain-containing protein n=1 Tax=Cinchona calisaya TaxID=153742 RepID=A0ABD3AK82_9GENT
MVKIWTEGMEGISESTILEVEAIRTSLIMAYASGWNKMEIKSPNKELIAKLKNRVVEAQMQETPSIHPMWAPRLYANASRINKKKRRRRRNSNAGCGEDSTVTSPPKRHRLITNSHAVAPQIQQGGHGHGDDNTSNCGKPSVMPEKHTLQLIIDILQRRDAYEIFAEPVDPNEVEDYYQIIKEPMDFGTMRAKLHEGMYQNLEQFKHDVFLITRNAMHFNSSATIYFRQARAIHELAKRVFHVLETDPENFQVEFSGTRRRSSRRAQSEASRIATDVTPSSVATNVYLQGTPSSVGASIFGKSSRGNSWLATTALHTNKKNYGFISGARAGQRFNYVEGDRRFTYRPQNYPFGCDNNLVGSKRVDSNPLILIWDQVHI